MKRSSCVLAVLAVTLGTAGPIGAVIKVDLPLSKVYASAQTVLIARVADVQAASPLAELAVSELLKGQAPARLRLQLAAPADLAAAVRPDQPVVAFINGHGPGAKMLVHLDDRWLLALPAGGDGSLWRTAGPHEAARTFPGRTAALARVVQDIKAGQRTFRDGVSHEAFTDGLARVIGQTAAGVTCLASADFDADSRLDLLAAGRAGPKLLLSSDNGVRDVTAAWGLVAAKAAFCAAADVDGDGKVDALVGRTIWLNRGQRFTAIGPPLDLDDEAGWLAAALADATGDGKPDVLVLLKTGKLLLAENPGLVGPPWPVVSWTLWTQKTEPAAAIFSAAWGDNGEPHVLVLGEGRITRYGVGPSASPPADFERLSGAPLSIYKDLGAMKVLLAAAFDYDGDTRTDLVVITETGGITLVNRGYGCFLINAFLHKQFHSRPDRPIKWTKPFPFRVDQVSAAAPGQVLKTTKRPRQNLFVVTADGRIWELQNTR
ncbi:MAG: FG-GAP repeat protein [Planctomycetes bacterium ADurb.Bin126]|nr:MAG: FG-GAP repeat protein [Planctomycetes bacterium ADurb.Bin126]HOD84467.1 VCBS repeat-containing protein [Phycisphaerae bacterium]HQL73363.1 VCBS repeat-containing protein [Phycisphaerae bacterium]